jgi:hypothetical protein
MWGSGTPIESYLADNPDEMWKKLEASQSLIKECLPTDLGGLWKRDRFQIWLERQTSKESGMVSCDHRLGAIPSLSSRQRARHGMKRRLNSSYERFQGQAKHAGSYPMLHAH